MQKTLWTLRYHWKTIVFWLATIMALSVAYVAHAATLEIPGPNSTQSGIQLISGWKCEANGPLTIRFDGGNAIPLLYGSERGDTRKPKGPCDKANTGFIAIMNWGNLGDGEHTAVVYDNGVEFDRATFRVVTTGTDFLQGVTGSGTATLSNGQVATVKWAEAAQGFVATSFTTAPTVGSGSDGNCTSRTLTATVYDSHRPRSGGRATWTVELDCEYPDKLYLDVTAHTAFGFSLAALSFVQDGYVYGFGHVYEEWLHPDTGKDYATGETDSLEIEREPGSGLDFRQPFTIRYYGNVVLTFE